MIFYSCKCGKSQAWSSMGVPQCERCPDCGSSLSMFVNGHTEPVVHRMRKTEVTMETDQGMISGILTRCVYCLKTKPELEKLGHPMVDDL